MQISTAYLPHEIFAPSAGADLPLPRVFIAPQRCLVAGMGDAMATWYEARVCLLNPAGVTTVGARPTLASSAIGEVCAQTLFKEGRAAGAAVPARTVNDAHRLGSSVAEKRGDAAYRRVQGR